MCIQCMNQQHHNMMAAFTQQNEQFQKQMQAQMGGYAFTQPASPEFVPNRSVGVVTVNPRNQNMQATQNPMAQRNQVNQAKQVNSNMDAIAQLEELYATKQKLIDEKNQLINDLLALVHEKEMMILNLLKVKSSQPSQPVDKQNKD